MIIQKLRAKSGCLRDFARCLAEKISLSPHFRAPALLCTQFCMLMRPILHSCAILSQENNRPMHASGGSSGLFRFLSAIDFPSDQSSNLTSRPVLEDS
jgi:hypothetical protein